MRHDYFGSSSDEMRREARSDAAVHAAAGRKTKLLSIREVKERLG